VLAVRGLAIPYNTPSDPLPSLDGAREMILPGGVPDIGALVGTPVVHRHPGDPVGLVTHAWEEREGIHIRVGLFDTQTGRDVREMWAALGFSAAFYSDPVPPGPDGIVRRGASNPIDVFHFATTPNPAYRSARILENRERTTMPFPETGPQAPQSPAPATQPAGQAPQPQPQPAGQAPQQQPQPAGQAPQQRDPALDLRNQQPEINLRELQSTVDDIVGRLSRSNAAPQAAPLAQYRSLEHFMVEAFHGRASYRALADQLTAENPGVIQPTWVTEILGIVQQVRAFIMGTGGPAGTPTEGLEISWPYYDGDLSTLIAQQIAQKTEISTHKVSFKRGTAELLTLAEGSDIALQLLRKSNPDYLTGYMRVLMQAWALKSEMWHVQASEAAATGVVQYDPLIDGSFYQAVIEASGIVQDVTGAPASIVGIRAASWAGVAGAIAADGRPQYPMGPSINAAGTAAGAGAQRLDIAGVPAARVQGLVGPALVTNGLATRWHEEGPYTIDANNVAQLGQDRAIYSFANTAPYFPGGIVKLVQV